METNAAVQHHITTDHINFRSFH